MTSVINHCRDEKKKEAKEKQADSEKNLKIPESEILECSEYDLKSKIGNIVVNEKTIEEYSVKIYEINPYFYEHYKKMQVGKNEREYLLFRIDVYF